MPRKSPLYELTEIKIVRPARNPAHVCFLSMRIPFCHRLKRKCQWIQKLENSRWDVILGLFIKDFHFFSVASISILLSQIFVLPPIYGVYLRVERRTHIWLIKLDIYRFIDDLNILAALKRVDVLYEHSHSSNVPKSQFCYR